MTHEPLKGVRVLDLSRFVSGPYCAMLLGDFGADVIKVEHPVTGDGTRRWSLPGIGPDNPYFMSVNRSKRSIGLDLKSETGKDVVKALAAKSDVLVSNFKAGALDRMGLGYDTLSEINPRLVYCEITGYGDTGPKRDHPAFDFPIQAESGLMSVIGEPDGAPMKVGFPVMDVLTALHACNGIQAALLGREKTGRGVKVSLSLIEAALASMTNIVSDYLIGDVEPVRWGNGHPNLAPYAAYPTEDGWLTVGVATEPQWQRFCEILERPDLQADERFAENPVRLAHRKELDDVLAPIFATDTRDAWLQKLKTANIPCAPINTVPQILADPQVEALEAVQTVAHPKYETIKMVRPPVSWNHERIKIPKRPPTLGEHTEVVLKEVLGMDDAAIASLREARAIPAARDDTSAEAS